jgi:DNA-binding CsgD family transcriptional regulator
LPFDYWNLALTPTDPAEPDQLLERTGELAAIDAAISDTRSGRGRLLVLEGPAGIGKTALLAVARRQADDSGMQVLSARGGDLERDFGFGVVGQLFEAAARRSPESLDTGQARLAATVLGLAGGDPIAASSDDAIFPALQGLYWLTVNLAEQRPLVLLLDDVHLADAASIRFVAFLGQRLEGLPVLVIAATRNGPDADQVFAALSPTAVLRPRPLTPSGTEALTQSIVPDADSRLCRACHEATGGNSFFVRELARALGEMSASDGRPAADRLVDWSPESVTRSVSLRLTRLPPPARQLARAAAVLGQDATLRHAALLGGLEPRTADSAADQLRAAGILTAAAGLEFVHPIVRAAVSDEIPAASRARTHAEAALLLTREGAGPERVAAHIMRSEPGANPTDCATLLAAARQALVRGAPDAAAGYLQRALAEPSPSEQHADLLLELAVCEGRIFDLDSASDHVRQAFAAAGNRDTRLRAALLAAALAGPNARAHEAIGLLETVDQEFAEQPGVTRVVRAHIANAARFERDTRTRSLSISAALGREDADDTDATVLAAAAAELAMAGRSAEQVARVASRGLAALSEDQRLVGSTVHLILIRTLLISDRFEVSGVTLDGLLAQSRATGSVLDFAFASVFRADLMYRRGDIFESEADARAAYGLMKERPSAMTPGIVAHVINALTERGEFAEAEAVLTEAGLDGSPGQLPPHYIVNLFLLARGHLRAAAGKLEPALEDLLECGRRQDIWREPNPALMPWRSEAALAHHALGQRDEALRLATEELDLARRFGAPRATGIALRAAAIVTGGEPGMTLAGEAVATLAMSDARLEHARARADLGELMRETATREERRAVLSEALELAHMCGATRLEHHVLAALREAGARPRRRRLTGPDALTPSERRVAQMAASGLTNREIAEALFLTVRTIEFHLLNCYRKLRIGGRRQLSAVLLGAQAHDPPSRAAPPG